MEVVGLTGNIACGKSLVEALLRDRGVPVIDADQVARQIVEPGTAALAAIAAAWPAVIADGRLDRAALGAVVFGSPAERARLEAITHPRIFEEIARQLAALAEAGAPLAVVSAALMVESGSWRDYAQLVVVTCPPEQQLARLLARDELDRAGAQARIDSQLPQADKAALAAVVIDNGGSVADTEAQVETWLSGARR